jgi:hypothetical protein
MAGAERVSAQVIRLVPRTKKKVDDQIPVYYCLRCDYSQFKLHPSGEVLCAGCGCAIRNLRIEKAGD